MTFGDINFILILFFFMFTSITININTALHLLLTAEFLWITLYIMALVIGFIYDNLNIVSLTFFFLILSAVEFGLGLVIILVQNVILRSINLNDGPQNTFKFTTRFKSKLNLSSPIKL
jgi:hypothetical protein